ncbi:hypothetical protein I541_5678 [Mycobacteroides abscessus]|nr:hypothetical protein I541_5678 [Mycobacteroides abscessus]
MPDSPRLDGDLDSAPKDTAAETFESFAGMAARPKVDPHIEAVHPRARR